MARETVHRGRKIVVQLDVSVMPNGQTVKRDHELHDADVVELHL